LPLGSVLFSGSDMNSSKEVTDDYQTERVL
jgi:hypothetical protein